MTRKRRYCINCGAEIGDSAVCTSPDCGAIPNFYRDVPGPLEEPSEEAPLPARAVPKAMDGGGSPSSGGGEPTVCISTTPVAVLRRVSPPHVEHLIYPGAVAIGAMPPATIIIHEPEVSSIHARLQCYLGKSSEWEFQLFDNCSTNGTYVNGSRIERSLVRSGDKIRFSGVEFELRILEESPPRLTVQRG
jgi:hypothetical protein